MLGVHLRDNLRCEGIERRLQAGRRLVASVDQPLQSATADDRGEIGVGAAPIVVSNVQETAVAGIGHAGKAEGCLLCDQHLTEADRYGHLPRRILKRRDINQSGQIIQQLTALVAQIIRMLTADLRQLDLAVEPGNLCGELVDVVMPC